MGNYSTGMIRGQINNFPEGQFVAVFEDKIVGYCASSRIDENVALSPHDWETISGNGFGSRHDPTGDWLYGIEMAVDERRRGLRIGKRLYEARRTLAERLELKGLVFGGRMPGFRRARRRAGGPEDYIAKVREGELRHPVIGLQFPHGFAPHGLLAETLPHDPGLGNASGGGR